MQTVAEEGTVRRWSCAPVVLYLAMMSASCALAPPGFTPPDSQTLTISPAFASVRAGSTQTFTPSMTGKSWTWSVNGIAGGNATLGTIDANGNYSAPALLPTPNTITIEAAEAEALGDCEQRGEAAEPHPSGNGNIAAAGKCGDVHADDHGQRIRERRHSFLRRDDAHHDVRFQRAVDCERDGNVRAGGSGGGRSGEPRSRFDRLEQRERGGGGEHCGGRKHCGSFPGADDVWTHAGADHAGAIQRTASVSDCAIRAADHEVSTARAG